MNLAENGGSQSSLGFEPINPQIFLTLPPMNGGLILKQIYMHALQMYMYALITLGSLHFNYLISFPMYCMC